MYSLPHFCSVAFFFFNDTATTEIYTLSLHDALPISGKSCFHRQPDWKEVTDPKSAGLSYGHNVEFARSEEHTSELQSLAYLVCRLLLEKKKNLPYRVAAALVVESDGIGLEAVYLRWR